MGVNLVPVPNYEGYLVDREGNLYSLWRRSSKCGSFLSDKPLVVKGHKNKGGHLRVFLKGGKGEYIHRLVYMTFKGEIPKGLVIRHLNDIPNDNRIENLEIGTSKQNSKDAKDNGRIPVGENNHNSRFTKEDILLIRSLKATKSLREIGIMFNVNPAYVSNIVNRKVWKHV